MVKTKAKAKAIQGDIEKLITLGKKERKKSLNLIRISTRGLIALKRLLNPPKNSA